MKICAEKIWKEWARYSMRRRMHCSVLLAAALCVVCMYSRGETAPMDTGAAPMVSFVNPANLSLDAADGKITATFTEKMSRKTINKETFIVRKGATPVQGRVTCVDSTAVFTPKKNAMEANTLYTATISAGVTDLEGNPMQNDFVWSFTTGAVPDTTPPEIDFVNPENLAENVPINRSITATFTKAMDPAKIKKNSFRLTKSTDDRNNKGNRRIKGTVAFTGTTAIFTPSENLEPNSNYTATIRTKGNDLSGNRFGNNYEWTFTTGSDEDITPPTVSLVTPENDATGVLLNKKIDATFSEEMDPQTITTATFRLLKGTTPVPGTVIYVGTTATFTPIDTLEDNTEYTSIITTTTTDLAGNPLQADYVWYWTTGGTVDNIAPTVTFTKPFDSGTNVPFDRKIAATFSETMDQTTITTDTFTLLDGSTPVSGTVVYSSANNVATFTPDSDLDPDTDYTSTITAGATDLAGNPLEADYVWYWTTGDTADSIAPKVTVTKPFINEINVPFNKKIAATFSETMDPMTITTDTFTLLDGSTPVSGTVVYDLISNVATFTADSDFDPDTAYSATISAEAMDLADNPLAADYVWNWTTGDIADITAPRATFTNPLDNETDVPINKKIAATFSEAMDPLTITTHTFTLLDGSTPVSGKVMYDLISNVATFTPDSDLDPDTEYTSTITAGATDLAGNHLEADYVWYWTTGDAADSIVPTVTFTIPSDNETDVPLNKKIAATFSEAMDPLTITTDTFTLLDGITPVTGAVVYDLISNVATFAPDSDLDPDTDYTSTITSGATDLTGNPLDVDYVWSWTTGATADTLAPTVTSTNPFDNETNVPINKKIAATFSEAIDPLTITAHTFTLLDGSTPVSGKVVYSLTSNVAMFTPDSDLDPDTEYTLIINTGATDLAGNPLENDYVWSFTTGTWTFINPETVIGFEPGDILQPYGVLAGTAITLGGSGLNVDGDVGIHPGSTCDGCDSTTVSGVIENGTVNAAAAKVALEEAYDDAESRTTNVCTLIASGILTANPSAACGGSANGVFKAGLYWSASSIELPVDGTITLDGENDPNAVFIFQAESTITSLANSHVVLANEARACNVFWVAGSSATIGGTTTDFAGTVIALQDFTVNTGTNMLGRALARNGSVTVQTGALITVPSP